MRGWAEAEGRRSSGSSRRRQRSRPDLHRHDSVEDPRSSPVPPGHLHALPVLLQGHQEDRRARRKVHLPQGLQEEAQVAPRAGPSGGRGDAPGRPG
eukprot:1506879-Heterocapsa_arctica.AAC.1